MPAAHRLTERRPQGAQRLMRGRRGAAVRLHPEHERFDVLRLQPLQPVRAETGHQVHADRDAVAVDGVLGHRRRGDVLDPVLQPARHGPRAARLADRAAVALPLQLAHLRRDLGFGLAADVPPVGLAVISYTDGHPTVPGPVSAEVDAGRAVGRAGSFFPFAGHADQTPLGASAMAGRYATYASRSAGRRRRRRPIRTDAIWPALMSA